MSHDFFTMVAQKNSQLCIGLDPRGTQLDLGFLGSIVEQTVPFAGAFKPNFAFFEQGGVPGLEILAKLIDLIHTRGTPVLLDVKRGDIGSTAEAYARAAFEVWNADAVTLSPYLGRDSIEPWIQQGKGIFVLCHTTNPGAADLQHQFVGGRQLYLLIAEMVQRWNMPGAGLVVGATYPQAIREVRSLAPQVPFLVPGVGAQGGDLQKSVAAGIIIPGGDGLLINASRSITGAANPAEAARKMHESILGYRRAALDTPVQIPDPHEELVMALFNAGCIRFGEFTLKSGLKSPVYIDLRLLISNVELLWQVARAYEAMLAHLDFDRMAAIPYAALPIATAMTLLMGKPSVYTRERKSHGLGKQIEGEWNPGETVAVVDDLITTGGSKLEVIEALIAAGLKVQDIVVLIDREQGGKQDLESSGYRLHSILTLRQILDILAAKGEISPDTKQEVETFLYG